MNPLMASSWSVNKESRYFINSYKNNSDFLSQNIYIWFIDNMNLNGTLINAKPTCTFYALKLYLLNYNEPVNSNDFHVNLL